jgi:hypothetical protein
MQKLLAGCLVIVVLGTLAVGVALYFGYRAAQPLIDDATGWVQQAKDMAAQSDRVENKAQFQPPASGELTEAQLRRYLAVHDRVRKALGPRWAELQAKGRSFEARVREGGRDLSLSEIGTILAELRGVMTDARSAHVDALNAERFSSSEYAWVRLRAYEAAGIEVANTIDWSALQDLIKKGTDEAGLPAPSVPAPDVPARNRELVKPHIDTLKEWLPLTVLGF